MRGRHDPADGNAGRARAAHSKLRTLLTPAHAKVEDVLAVDVAAAMLEQLCAAHGCAGPLGNEPGVRTWLGDVESVPAYQASPGRL